MNERIYLTADTKSIV